MSPRPDAQESTLTESRSDQKVERPRLWKVLLHNDDYTTQEFVVWILESIFNKQRAEAFTIMLSVHRSGQGLAGVYTHDVAETKLKATRQAAEEHEFPLLVTMEPEENREYRARPLFAGDAGNHPALLPPGHGTPPRHGRARAFVAGDYRRATVAPHPRDMRRRTECAQAAAAGRAGAGLHPGPIARDRGARTVARIRPRHSAGDGARRGLEREVRGQRQPPGFHAQGGGEPPRVLPALAGPRWAAAAARHPAGPKG